MKIEFYANDSGKSSVLDFIRKLDKPDRAKILSCLESVQDLGLECPRVQFRQIDGKLWEIKITTPNGGYRIFYVCMKHDLLILLHAYKKQGQKAPKKEIELATKRLKEVLANENDTIK
ncbi:MAG TPA: type II toxin-antitoxin system RelE/ParE family toxin [Candidatus Margulisbacteria bacterium]|nr:MAG: hypothetical protein A2X43_10840 [Candidatus Margulisbacteria bacterium GWD2_39_127]HAR64100.1 type II toxin-antitoxin system RelE/ParE family toxin [Candidatus Margulisiibacteriota bacterium]